MDSNDVRLFSISLSLLSSLSFGPAVLKDALLKHHISRAPVPFLLTVSSDF